MTDEYLRQQFGLDGKRAVVTGAGRGIGRAIAEGLAAAGAEVLVHYNASQDAAGEVVATIERAGGTAWAARADLSDSEQAARLFALVRERWGALDVLVNNAGDLVGSGEVADFTDDLADAVVRVNLHTTLYAAREAIPLMRRGRNPSIINLGSVAGHNGGANGAALYAATKGAIHAFTRGLAKELAPEIRVNAIAPGVVLTDLHRNHTTPEALKQYAETTPRKRLGRPEDHAAAAVFLSAAGSSFITGEIMNVNGGLWMC